MTTNELFVIGIAVAYVVMTVLILNVCSAGKHDNNEDDQEHRDCLDYYKSKKGGKKRGNKTKKP